MLAAYCLEGPAKSEEKRAVFELRRVDRPLLDNDQEHPPGTLLIRTVASSICGTDFWGCCGHSSHYWRRPLDYLKRKQHACGGTGHEILGDVVQAVEPCCSSIEVGTRVLAMAPTYIRHINHLRNAYKEATGMNASDVLPDQGGFCEYFVSHESACFAVPCTVPRNDFDPLWYVTAQPLATVLNACEHLDDNIVGNNVAIVGQGQNGLIMTQLAVHMGARRIIALDLLEHRLEVSKRLKATHTIQVQLGDSMMDSTHSEVARITNGAMCDVVMDFAGHQNQSLDLCARLAKDYGTVLMFGLPPAQEEAQFEIHNRDFVRNLTYKCSSGPRPRHFVFALELLEQGRFDPSLLYTHKEPFERFPEVYDMASNYKDKVIKVLLTY